MKQALITGITGQDGSYLAELLLAKGYHVVGLMRRNSTESTVRIRHLLSDIELIDGDMLDLSSLVYAVTKARPDEIYNLAAQSHVGVSWKQPILTSEVTGLGAARLFEAARLAAPDARIYQASTSELFGSARETPQTETTPFYPRSPYGVAKLYAHWMAKNYRESYGMHISCGILFNHESPRRGLEFVTRKITHGAAAIKKGTLDRLYLGNLDAKRDFGFAGDYVRSMHAMLRKAAPDDYVIATGKAHSIKDFCTLAFTMAGINLEWNTGPFYQGTDTRSGRVVVKVDSQYFRPAEVDVLIGSSLKAKVALGWQPKTDFIDLVRMMVEADLA